MATVHEENGIFELRNPEDLDPALCNRDILPIPLKERTWNTWHIASLWVGMAVCIPTYMLASNMITGGLSWKEAITMIFLGNLLVSIPMVFNGHAGTKYGIPFPVLGRASFGIWGIHIPSILRAIVACGWFGIQTWIGGLAIHAIFKAVITGILGFDLAVFDSNPLIAVSFKAIETLTGNCDPEFKRQFFGFIIFWMINMFFVWRGTETIKVLEEIAAPLLILIGLGMLYWGISNAGGLDRILESSYEFKRPSVDFHKTENGAKADFSLVKARDGKIRATRFRFTFFTDATTLADARTNLEKMDFSPLKNGISLSAAEMAGVKGLVVQFRGEGNGHSSSMVDAELRPQPYSPSKTPWATYVFWLTAMVAFWATLALNIPDITRFSRSQKDQVAGQFLGLPTTMVLYSFIGVAVTCAAILIFDDILITNDAPWDPVSLLARFENRPYVVIMAQLAMILATLSTNIAANVISPANSFANLWPAKISFRLGGLITGVIGILILPWKLLGVIVGYLLTYGAVLGPVLAILIADYFLIRRLRLDLLGLYRRDGVYCYSHCLFPGVNSLAVLSLLAGIGVVFSGLVHPSLKILYDSGWFTGFGVSFVVYMVLMKSFGRAKAELPTGGQ